MNTANENEFGNSLKIFSTLIGWLRWLGPYAQLAIFSPVLVWGVFPLIPIEFWVALGINVSPELYSEHHPGVRGALEMLLLLICFVALSDVYHYSVREPKLFLEENKQQSFCLSEERGSRARQLLEVAEKKLLRAPFIACWAEPVHERLRLFIKTNSKEE